MHRKPATNALYAIPSRRSNVDSPEALMNSPGNATGIAISHTKSFQLNVRLLRDMLIPPPIGTTCRMVSETC